MNTTSEKKVRLVSVQYNLKEVTRFRECALSTRHSVEFKAPRNRSIRVGKMRLRKPIISESVKESFRDNETFFVDYNRVEIRK